MTPAERRYTAAVANLRALGRGADPVERMDAVDEVRLARADLPTGYGYQRHFDMVGGRYGAYLVGVRRNRRRGW